MGNPLAGLLPAPACFSAPSRSFRRRFGPPYWNATTPLNFRSTLGGRYVWGDASALFSRNKMCDKGEWIIHSLKKAIRNLDLHLDPMDKEKGMRSRLELSNHFKVRKRITLYG
uniref:Uncharacterized protein n=1 Tax=Opuntia streptacantha TaxID=393608 RepID=A0A7C9EYZ4_OPUST